MAIPTLERRALYERFLVDEMRAARAQVAGEQYRRAVAKDTHEQAVQALVAMMFEASQRKEGARVLVHLDERISGKIPQPLETPPALPPFVLMIGTNGGHVALGYAPQGIVPGMETFMPPEVKALPAPAGNGHGGKRRPRKDRP